MSHGNEMICQQVTLSGYAEWPKMADAVIEAELTTESSSCVTSLRGLSAWSKTDMEKGWTLLRVIQRHPASIPANSETLRATAHDTQERSNSSLALPSPEGRRCQPHADEEKDGLRSQRSWESHEIC